MAFCHLIASSNSRSTFPPSCFLSTSKLRARLCSQRAADPSCWRQAGMLSAWGSFCFPFTMKSSCFLFLWYQRPWPQPRPELLSSICSSNTTPLGHYLFGHNMPPTLECRDSGDSSRSSSSELSISSSMPVILPASEACIAWIRG